MVLVTYVDLTTAKRNFFCEKEHIYVLIPFCYYGARGSSGRKLHEVDVCFVLCIRYRLVVWPLSVY